MSGAANTMATLWGGRFEQVSDDTLFRQFNDSLPFDYRLAEQDIQASMAWAAVGIQAARSRRRIMFFMAT